MSDSPSHAPPPTPPTAEQFNGGNNGNDHVPLKLTPDLEKCRVTGIAREGTKIVLNYNLKTHDNQQYPKILSFNISQKGLTDTLENFDRVARGTWGPNRKTRLSDDLVEKTKVALSTDPYYQKKLKFYKRDMEDTADKRPDIGDS